METQFLATKKKGTLVITAKQKKSDRSQYSLTKDEVQRLLSNCTLPRDRAILMLMVQSALRRHEAVNLRIRNVDFERALINLEIWKGSKRYEKTSEELAVPITSACLHELKVVRDSLRDKRPDAFIFVSRNSQARLSLVQINNIVAKWGNKAGIKSPIPTKARINPHLLRHTCIRLFLDNGGDYRIAQRIARHEKIETTMGVYGVPSLEKKKEEFARVVTW